MNPIQFSVTRPYTVAVGVLLAVLFSLLALETIPVQLKPTIDTPRITAQTTFRGASAVEVEEQVTRELEEVLEGVEGLVEMTSDSAEGQSTITLEFDFGTDTQLAVIDVINKLSRVPSLPPEADETLVEVSASAAGDQIMWISIDSQFRDNEVRRIVRDNVEARLKRVPGVSRLLVVGGSENEIQVLVDPDLLVGRGVSFEDLARALTSANLNIRGGTVESSGRQLVVRTIGRADVPARLEEITVLESDAGSVLLGDVARVVDTYRETTGFVNIDGTPGVAIGVSRKEGSNVVEIIDGLDAAMAELNAQFQSRGLDVHLRGVYRETTYISAAIGFVLDNLLVGAGLAILVLLAFLRSPRSVAIVAFSIPISLVTVFLVLRASGRTLNVISLAGLAFASGMVVDNAIVVLENVFRHLEMGKDRRTAAIEGGREVWGGVLASTLTTVAVFLPILVQGSETTQLFTDMALAISAAVVISLAVSLTVVPVLCSIFLRGSKKEVGTPLGFVGVLYGRLIERVAHARALPGKLGFVLLLCAAALATVRLTPPAEYLPSGNRNLIMFFAAPIPGTHPEEVRDNFRPLEDFILAQPETEQVFAVTGPFFNGGGVVLKDEFSDAASLAEYFQRLYGPAASLSGFQFVVPVRSSLFEDPGKQFEVELSGPDFATLERASAELQGRLFGVPGVEFVRSSLVTGKPELQVHVNEARSQDVGLSVQQIGRVVETAVAGRRLTALIEGGREVDVNVLVPPERIASPEDLAAMRFFLPSGDTIALGSVADVRRDIGPVSVRRLERERNVLLTVNLGADAPLETVVREIETSVFPQMSAQLGPAYSLRVGGSADKLKTTLESLTSGFGLSVLITYLLLVALFASWFAPFVILTTVPLALSGGLIGITAAHAWTDGMVSFDVISMLGFVILAGLVVNNAILIVHQAANFRRGGLDARSALVESTRSRLRPIVMTVITTAAGMVPLALGGGAGAELYQGLGAVLVGGLLISAFFTLFLVPVLISIGHDLVDLGRGRAPAASPMPRPAATLPS